MNSSDLKREYIQYSNSIFEFDKSVGFHKTYVHEEKDESENRKIVETMKTILQKKQEK
jgi:hypothetical protein